MFVHRWWIHRAHEILCSVQPLWHGVAGKWSGAAMPEEGGRQGGAALRYTRAGFAPEGLNLRIQ